MSNDGNQTNANREQAQTSGQEAKTVAERPLPTGQPVRQRVQEPVQTAVRPVDTRRSLISRLFTGENVKFGIMAVILVAVPFVIALLIPLIFGQIVPAVLGYNLPTSTPLAPGNPVVVPDTAETPTDGLTTDPQTGIGGEATPVPVTPPAGQATPDDVLVHIVRSGDTLAAIARQYGVTAEEIAAVNNLQDPNQIFSGQLLIIPQQ